jgi:exopolyphosphatase
MNEFLKSIPKNFSLCKQNKITIILGNEASDLDSIASSLSYAYFLQQKEQSGFFIPVLNIPSHEFKLRTETTWFFKKLDIDYSLLLFWPEIEKQNLENVDFILTDHNVLSNHQRVYSSNVTEIIDHHVDEKKYSPKKRIIESVGSVCTLIGERILHQGVEIPLPILELILGTILLDTMNLNPIFKKVKEKDIQIANELSKLCQYTSKDQLELYEKLQMERFNVESLSSLDLLKSDYKEMKRNQVNIGISSVKCSLFNWIKKDSELEKVLSEFTKENGVDLLFCMNAYFVKDEFFRDLLIFSKDKEWMKKMEHFLLVERQDLKLVKLEHESLFIYSQKNIAASRKVLDPLLKEYFEK